MPLLDVRRRTGWLFTAVVVAHLVLISTQVTTRRGVPLIEEAVFGAFAELQRAATAGVTAVQDAWQNYLALQQARRENERLSQELARLQVRLQQERATAEQARALEGLLELRTHVDLTTTGARIIGAGASPDFRTVTIDKGSADGLRVDMAVIAPAGVVGRVVLPTPRASKVQLIIDRSAAAGALVERTRTQGLVIGTGTDVLRLEYIPDSADLKVGDRVVTSGIDGIYPKGFAIGRIKSIEHGRGDGSGIVVEPAVSFATLEAVLVVLSPPAATAP